MKCTFSFGGGATEAAEWVTGSRRGTYSNLQPKGIHGTGSNYPCLYKLRNLSKETAKTESRLDGTPIWTAKYLKKLLVKEEQGKLIVRAVRSMKGEDAGKCKAIFYFWGASATSRDVTKDLTSSGCLFMFAIIPIWMWVI